MKIVVIGGSGLVGTKLVALLREQNSSHTLKHEILAASPSLGVNAVTGAGLAQALEGAHVVIDVSDSSSFDDAQVLEYFETSTRNLLAAEVSAGTVRRHIVLSVVGYDLVPDCGYLRAKVAQENLVKAGPIPYTILRATQFFEFVGVIAQCATTDGQTIRVPAAMAQPIQAGDVSAALAKLVLSLGDEQLAMDKGITIDIAGPERMSFEELVRRFLRAKGGAAPDSGGGSLEVVADNTALYFGGKLEEESLVPTATRDGKAPLVGLSRFQDWLHSTFVSNKDVLE